MNTYLDNVKKNKTKMKIFLTNGTMLEGVVIDFDDDCIIVDKCLVFIDKVISITPRDK
jgi:RNA chaperone Hfq